MYFPGKRSAWTVSYTHLDVYKRQVETQSGKMIESTESSSETEVKESKETEESKEIESEEPEKEFIRTME